MHRHINRKKQSPILSIPKSEIDAALAQSPAEGKRMLEPIRTLTTAAGMPLNILEDSHTNNLAEVHRTISDLWLCLEGEATFIHGGALVEPRVKEKNGVRNENELLAASIHGGTETIMHPGDWLWIPAGTPHQHQAIGTARLAIIKIPA
ncbi:MAG: hypothetical protein Q8Q94_03035 [bacterium]|nr:hypothetical protein [bacterium]MDZ4299515.1 hypothetical protein [Candidatus Sungbacteria bacterium]